MPSIAARKRVVDVVAVLASAPVTVPVSLLTALVVRAKLGRPVLFRQRRIGWRGAPFDVYKFRSMTDARDASGSLLPDSERLTPFGRLLRRTSLDEIPQLLNVLRGDMSLVGPRPLLPAYLPHYRGEEHRRHDLRPGITGLAQVSGRNDLGWDDRLATDVRYVATATVRGDLWILLRTAALALGARGVSTVAGHTGEPLHVERAYPVVDGLSMRRFATRDIPARVRWMNHPATREFMRLPDVVTEESTRAWLEAIHSDPRRRDWVVYDVATGTPVAMIGLREIATDELPEMYLFVDPERRGQRAGTRSLAVLCRWLEQSHEYPGCRLSTAAGNVAARRLYERAGFLVTHVEEDGRTHMSLDLADVRSEH